MTALCELEETVPGVGVFTPGIDQLECDAARFTASGLAKVEHSCKRLILHVHDAAVLADALSVSPDTVSELHIEYHVGGTYNNLKWALADLNTANLEFLLVTGVRLTEWQADLLYSLYQLPTMEVGGITYHPPKQEPGERVEDGFHWIRRFGDTAAVQVAHLPFVDANAKHLIVDCDNQFHPTYYPTSVDALTLAGIMASPDELLRFADKFEGKKLHITSLDSGLARYENALTVRLRSRGIEFILEV